MSVNGMKALAAIAVLGAALPASHAADLRGERVPDGAHAGIAAANVTWRIWHASWEDDVAYRRTADFFRRNGLTGRIAFIAGDSHLPPSLERAAEFVPALVRRIADMKAHGHEVGINLLATLGHLDENLADAAKVEGATHWTAFDGTTCHAYCPNDPVYRERYLKRILVMYAQAKPDFIWLDDDIRLANRRPARGAGCFCERCMERLRARLGYSGGRAGLVAFFADPDKGLERRRRMLALNRETLADLLSFIRVTVGSVDPNIVLGAMDESTTDWNGLPFLEKYRALAPTGREKVLWRPGGGFYNEQEMDEMVVKANAIGCEAAWLPDGVASIESEVECFNYRRLGKSDEVLAGESLLDIAVGATGTAWNILPPEWAEDYSVYDRTVKSLEALRPKFDAYAKAAGRERPRGVWNCYGRDRCVGVNPGGDWFDRRRSESFLDTDLQKMGLPAAYREEEAEVYVPTVESVHAAMREDLERWLSRGLYLSADVLSAFIARGYGADVGFVPVDEGKIDVCERNEEHFLNSGIVGKVREARQSFWGGTATFLKPLPGARIVTSGVDLRGRFITACLSGTYENGRGGRVFASGYFPSQKLLFSPTCRRIKRTFEWLSRGALSGWVDSYHRMALWVRGDKTVVLHNMSEGEALDVEIVLRGPAWARGLKVVGEPCGQVVTGRREGNTTRYRLPKISGHEVVVYAPAEDPAESPER